MSDSGRFWMSALIAAMSISLAVFADFALTDGRYSRDLIMGATSGIRSVVARVDFRR